jgi:hypothetical protein
VRTVKRKSARSSPAQSPDINASQKRKAEKLDVPSASQEASPGECDDGLMPNTPELKRRCTLFQDSCCSQEHTASARFSGSSSTGSKPCEGVCPEIAQLVLRHPSLLHEVCLACVRTSLTTGEYGQEYAGERNSRCGTSSSACSYTPQAIAQHADNIMQTDAAPCPEEHIASPVVWPPASVPQTDATGCPVIDGVWS